MTLRQQAVGVGGLVEGASQIANIGSSFFQFELLSFGLLVKMFPTLVTIPVLFVKLLRHSFDSLLI